MRLTNDFITLTTGAKCLSHADRSFKTVGTDTRKALNDLLFVALRGEQFDGHDYIEQAVKAGAQGVVIHDESKVKAELISQVAVYVVPDTLRALQMLARGYRKRMRSKVIGITGSNGKTTTKEFTAQILSENFNTHYSVGSFNNHWGVPFSLLELNEEHQMAVIEMGMNHAGEIAELVRIADPDLVVCTMVGRAHIENFPQGLKGVAAAKEEIYLNAKDQAVRIYSLDQEETREMWHRGKQIYPRTRILTFSQTDEKADVYLKIERVNISELVLSGRIGTSEVILSVPVFGSHNSTNVLAAITIAHAVGMSSENILMGLKRLKTTWGRNQFVRLASGAQVIFDGYNANPDSMAALLTNSKLVQVQGQKIGVFGQMRELGENSKQFHRELGADAAKAGFDILYFVGVDHESFKQGAEEASFTKPLVCAVDYTPELGQQLKASIQSHDAVFMKASRGTRIERFFEFLEPENFKAKP